MELLREYGLFLAKVLTILAAAVGLIASAAGFIASGRRREKEWLNVQYLNDKFEDMADAIRAASLPDKEIKKSLKARNRKHKTRQKTRQGRKRLYVLDFQGDIRASAVTALREEITAVLMAGQDGDSVLVRLESGGGLVHSYGLAASQLLRLREQGMPLTIAVDKIAASGGYMMACVANQIVAAPFAVLGSIGVLSQLPNFNRLLKRHDIDFEQIAAGEYKRTLSLFGENTEDARVKVRAEVEDTHVLFKNFVSEYRPMLNIERVSSGEHWYGVRALELGLVDKLQSSDDFLLKAVEHTDIYLLSHRGQRKFIDRLFPHGAAHARGIRRLLETLLPARH